MRCLCYRVRGAVRSCPGAGCAVCVRQTVSPAMTVVSRKLLAKELRFHN